MDDLAPFRQAERQQLREVAKDIINGGHIQKWNEAAGRKYAPLIQQTVMCLGRESAELLHLPYPGGYLEQPTTTMAAVSIVQHAFSERLRQEYEKSKKGIKRG